MSKTNIVKYNFLKSPDGSYRDEINNYIYFLNGSNLYLMKDNKAGFYRQIYVDQFLDIYFEETGRRIEEIDKFALISCAYFNVVDPIENSEPANLDFIKTPINKLIIHDNSFIITNFEKHFKTIKMFFGGTDIIKNMEMGKFRSIFIKNIVNIKNHNYDKLVIEHHVGESKDHYYYCSADHNLCKIRDQLNLKNVVIKNVNNEIEFEDEDFVNYCDSVIDDAKYFVII